MLKEKQNLQHKESHNDTGSISAESSRYEVVTCGFAVVEIADHNMTV